MAYVDDVAGEFADKALAEESLTGDGKIVDQIGEILGASSQTLQEAYLTAIRVRRAERRVRQLLDDRAAKRAASLRGGLTHNWPFWSRQTA